KQAFEAEVARWQAEDEAAQAETAAAGPLEVELAEPDAHVVSADISGNVWKLLAEPGSVVKAGDPLLILEAMKMEFHISAPRDGVVSTFHCRTGMLINAGDPLVSLKPAA